MCCLRCALINPLKYIHRTLAFSDYGFSALRCLKENLNSQFATFSCKNCEMLELEMHVFGFPFIICILIVIMRFP